MTTNATATTSPTAVARRFYELTSAGDLDSLDDLVADGYVGHGQVGADGKAGLRQDLASMLDAFPDLTFEVRETVTEAAKVAKEAKVAVHTTMRGTHRNKFAGVPGSGRSIEVAGTDIFRIADGQIVEAWTLCDSGALYMQIGAVPTPGGP